MNGFGNSRNFLGLERQVKLFRSVVIESQPRNPALNIAGHFPERKALGDGLQIKMLKKKIPLDAPVRRERSKNDPIFSFHGSFKDLGLQSPLVSGLFFLHPVGPSL